MAFLRVVSPDPKVHEINSSPEFLHVTENDLRFIAFFVRSLHDALIAESKEGGEDSKGDHKENTRVDDISLDER